MKKFSVPCDFNGTNSPFTIYVGSPKQGHHPIFFQADWVSKNRGGTISSEIMDSLLKLKELSDKNGVSFEDLCVYALGTAQQEMTDDTDEEADENEETEDTDEDEEIDDAEEEDDDEETDDLATKNKDKNLESSEDKQTEETKTASTKSSDENSKLDKSNLKANDEMSKTDNSAETKQTENANIQPNSAISKDTAKITEPQKSASKENLKSEDNISTNKDKKNSSN